MDAPAFTTLGRSGLVVSRLALGTMTFGAAEWGSSDEASRAVFNTYVESGGTFVDTADVYGDGRSEELVGSFVAERTLRDRIVLATKFSFNDEDGNPNAGGNGRKNLRRALGGSLRRLQTGYVDLFYAHVWDMVTPLEEVVQALAELVRDGTIRYYGLSDCPAWYAAAATVYAQAHGLPAPIALQLEYSLVNRSVEREHRAAARALGLGLVPWGPLAAGFLSGKYVRTAGEPQGEGRFSVRPAFRTFTDRAWHLLDVVRAIATEAGQSSAQVALAWLLARSGVSSVLIGARSGEQLRDNLAAAALVLPAGALQQLDEASAPEEAEFFTPGLARAIFGGHDVSGWPSW